MGLIRRNTIIGIGHVCVITEEIFSFFIFCLQPGVNLYGTRVLNVRGIILYWYTFLCSVCDLSASYLCMETCG